MVRVGLTGGLGSGKSTVSSYLKELGAEVIQADEVGRELMEPGHAVFDEIVEVFGPEVVGPDGHLDRARLAELAFRGGRLHELNAIVHPAVIAAQGDWMRQVYLRDPKAVAVVESALIFEVERDARLRGESEGILTYWRRRFDRVIVVAAPDEVKIARYVARLSPGAWDEKIAADARSRLAQQLSDAVKKSRADYVIENSGDFEDLKRQVDAVWMQLRELGNNLRNTEFIQ
ncbi:dephospho-CoA kinase [Acidicapsa dinghuensis]|uniref:Dephospho-CoA kinase n=1 Tax=Acidicapsa dinghuensis TaxID=2218256 RepID=A0ABW1EGI0_9BACT|nr:dephospho-CoA kinase [Acidicapsa dinghuensis]